MRDAAVITGHLVDVRNAGQHKEIVLKIVVPAELAMTVMTAFGWATQVNPIPVAVARLEPAGAGPDGHPLHPSTPPDACPAPPPNSMGAKRLARQAGMLCKIPAFMRFMIEEGKARDHDDTADAVRAHCGVASRSEILPGTPAAEKWEWLVSRYMAWLAE